MALLPLVRGDEEYLMCDMSLAKGYAMVHAIADQAGAKCVWADEVTGTQESTMTQAREIIKKNSYA